MDSGAGSSIDAQITKAPIASQGMAAGHPQHEASPSRKTGMCGRYRRWQMDFCCDFWRFQNQVNQGFHHCPQAINLRVTLVVVACSNKW